MNYHVREKPVIKSPDKHVEQESNSHTHSYFTL